MSKTCNHCGEEFTGEEDEIVGVTRFTHIMETKEGELVLDQLRGPEELYHKDCYNAMKSN